MAAEPNSDRLRLIIEAGEAAERQGQDREDLHAGPHDPLRSDRSFLDPDSEMEPNDEETKERRSRLLPVALALIALGAFAGVAWYAYDWGLSTVDNEEVPVLRADTGPIKTRPATPGGREIPNRDSVVLNEITPDPNKPQVERLLPPPEVPLAPARENAGAASPATTVELPAQPAAPSAVDRADTRSATSDLKTAAGPEATAPALSSPPPRKAEPEPVPAKPAPPQTGTPSQPAATPQSASLPLSGGYVVQLSALKDKSLVTAEWARLRKAFPALLGDLNLDVQDVNLGQRGVFHRLRAGVFADRAAAVALCGKLKARKQDCFVVRR